jgi:hypothetical protein
MRVPVGEVSDKTQRCAGHKVNKIRRLFPKITKPQVSFEIWGFVCCDRGETKIK